MNAPRVDHSAYIEKALEELIERHGAARVRADLCALLPVGRWQDWQRLVNITNNIQNRNERNRTNDQ